jgi:CBS domain-containing protein
MKVREAMTPNPTTCSPESSLAGVASRMWLASCGAVPVVVGDGKVVGILTDRDICFAVSARDRPASDIRVSEVGSGTVYTCSEDDDLGDALRRMSACRVRRLPVVDVEGRLKGMLSLTDAILQKRSSLTSDDVVETLRSVCRPQPKVADPADLHA